MKQEREQAIEVLTDLGPLEGLPGNARFTPVLGKQPITKRWNEDPSTWLTLKAYETRKKALTDALPKSTILDQQKIPVELAADEELVDLMIISRKLASMEVVL
tara:strand:+ start:267 stop:575 length:309 start_codon:yes stop_codon:yes gene_type:complete